MWFIAPINQLITAVLDRGDHNNDGSHLGCEFIVCLFFVVKESWQNSSSGLISL